MKKKKQVIFISIIILGISIVIAFVLNILFKVTGAYIFQAEWEAGDALNYAGSIFGAVGTIILGYVAYKQNDKLQELEENNYIANYSSMIVLNRVVINSNADIPVNWDTEHTEQIILDKDVERIEIGSYVGYKLEFEASYLGNNIPALLHVRNCDIVCSDEKDKTIKSYLFGENPVNTFSRIAIHKDGIIKFNITYVIDSKKRNKFEETIKQHSYKVMLEMQFDIVTDKNVITECKCRSDCRGENIINDIQWEGTDPMVFFYGHKVINVNELKISGNKQNIK